MSWRAFLNGILIVLALCLTLAVGYHFQTVEWASRNIAGMLMSRGFGILIEQEAGYIGRAFLQTDKLNQAERPLLDSLAIDPYSEFRRDLAYLYLKKGDLARARSEAMRHVANFRDDGWGYLVIAETTSKLGHPPPEARAILEAGLEQVELSLARVRVLSGEANEQEKRKHERMVAKLEDDVKRLKEALEKLEHEITRLGP